VSRSRSFFIAVALTIGAGGARALAAPAQPEGAELVGTAAPGWTVSEWIGANGRPVAWPDLRGKVVLVRWFTSAECPFCHATAPALNRFHRDYARRGLAVIGMYHHKRPEPLTLDAVRATVHDYGFEFPVGIDRDWRTLNRWWLGGRKRDFTSVSFLIDKHGVIRHIHRGGSLELGTPDFAVMQKKVEQLLAESP
jgi:peroxiredoxin